MLKFIHFTISFFIVLFYSCSEDQLTEPILPSLPSLSDPIPYEQLGSGKIVFERIGPQSNNYQGIYIIDIDNGRVWGFSGIHSYPSISPNGEKIAYTQYSSSDTKYDVFVMNIDGSGSVNISKVDAQERFPSWSPSSSKIYYYFLSSGVGIKLVEQRPTNRNNDRRVIKSFIYPISPPNGPISTSNNLISYSASDGIHIMGIDGSNDRIIVQKPNNRYLESPSISSDEQFIVYLAVDRDSEREYHLIEVMIIDINGNNSQTVATVNASGSHEWSLGDQKNKVSICWSPTNQKLLFNVNEGDLLSHLYLINSDGSGLTKVTTSDGVTDRCVSWSK